MGAYALLVGISEFVDPRLAKLNAPKSDVEAFARVLQDPLRGGFDSVISCIDQDLQTIRDQLAALLDGRNPDDMVLLFYSGHGIMTKGQRLFLATGQSSFDRPQARSLSALEMRDMLEQSRAGKQVVILDCCHSGAFVDGSKGVAQTITDDTFGCDNAEGQYVLTATDALQFAYDSAGTLRENTAPAALSRFTGWLVDAIGKGEASPESDIITLDAVFDYLSRRARVEAAGMTPKRFVKRSSGEMVIARNPLAQPAKLPDELIAQLDSKDWQQRRDAVVQLGKTADQPRFRDLVEQAVVDRLSAERDVAVRAAMLKLLGRLGTDVPAAETVARPSVSAVDMRAGSQEAVAATENWRRRGIWAGAAAGALALLVTVGYLVLVPGKTPPVPNPEPAVDVSPATAALRTRVADLTPDEALRVAKAMEPNLVSRRQTIRDFIKGVDPLNTRLTEGPVAKYVLELWVVNDDGNASSIKQWMDSLGTIDADRRRAAAEAAARETDAARQREAEAARQREAEAARQREVEAARQRDALGQRAILIEVQRALVQAGFYNGAPDGNLGPATQAAIIAFQRSANLPATGMADDALLAKLKETIAATTLASRVPDASRARPDAPRADNRTQPNPGTEFKDCAECPAMIAIPSGSFTMGSPASETGRSRDEAPQHRVAIPANFAVGKYEVTFAEWDNCVADGGCNNYRPPDDGWGRGNHPVIHVNWNDAQAYIAWLRRKTGKPYRLLSEAEWEYAARAGTVAAFYWGARATASSAKYNANNGTAPVGSYAPNSFGLYDMSGNVSEWAYDCLNNSYAGAPDDGKPWMTGDCDLHALRGGAWNSGPNNLRSGNRDWDAAGFRVNRNGFRVARGL